MKLPLFIVFFFCFWNQVCSGVFQKYYSEAMTIVQSMTLDQKIGQTIQLDFYGLTRRNHTSDADAVKYALGSILVGGDGCPDKNGNRVDFSGVDFNQAKTIFANATVKNWQKLAKKFNYNVKVTVKRGKVYRIKPFLATDAVHGDQHVAGNIIFPHNIGLSCSHNPENFYNTGFWTYKSLKRYGFNYAFAPTVAVSHNPQWGRFYETMGQDHDMIFQFAKAYTEGLQGKPEQFTGIMGSVKHFFADGATFYGADQGNAQVGSYKSFVTHNVQGYNSSIAAGIGSVMASYSAINFVPLSSGPYINSILRKDLGFDGFVISDYAELQKHTGQYLPTSFQVMALNESVVMMLNAGVDMFMLPSQLQMTKYIDSVKMGLQNQTITIERLNDAVAKILSVKLALKVAQSGRFEENNQTQVKIQQGNHQTTEYQDSLNAIHESLVLLKNQKVLPIQASKLDYVVLVGQKILNINGRDDQLQLFLNYDNIGMQSGGWSSRWQGFEGNSIWSGENKKSSNASSIIDGLKNLNQKVLSVQSQFNLVYPNYTSFTDLKKISNERQEYLQKLQQLKKNMTSKNTLIISVVGQSPYAEMVGDINNPYCQNKTFFGEAGCIWWASTYSPPMQSSTLNVSFNEFEEKIIRVVKGQDQDIQMVTVLLSGRPMIINSILNDSSAFISAFLPGTSGGQGIVDSMFGQYALRPNKTSRANTLSFDWPRSMESLKNFPYYAADGEIPTILNPLFNAGYGLSTIKTNLRSSRLQEI